MSDKYRPSNGSEGQCFRAVFCDQCTKDINHNCPIYLKTLIHEVNDPEYPAEWVRGISHPGVCLAFDPMRAD